MSSLGQKKVGFEMGKNYKIPETSIVKVTDLKEEIVIKNSWRKPQNLKSFKRISGSRYIDLRSGKAKEYKKKKFKTKKEIKEAMNRLKMTIKRNFEGVKNGIFITLTSSEEVKSIKNIKKYTGLFLRKLEYKYKNAKFAWIYKFEKNNHGWHTHILLYDSSKKVNFIPNEDIEKIWKKGITKTQRINDEKIVYKNKRVNIADYLAKTTQLVDINIPSSASLWGANERIVRPKTTKEKYKNVRDKIDKDFYKKSEKTILVKDTETKKNINKIKTEIYKRK